MLTFLMEAIMAILRNLDNFMRDTAPTGSSWEHMIRASSYAKECFALRRFDVLDEELDQCDLEEMDRLIARFLECMVTGDTKGLDAVMSERSFVREAGGLSPEHFRWWHLNRHPHLKNKHAVHEITGIGMGQHGLFVRVMLLYKPLELVNLTIYVRWDDPDWKIAEIHHAI